ncbi:uncharacterized protein LOC127798288 isoform X2 [Diospyros lotus]|uniref:uncharacterized protein LOC127798288 isoform X2 n=1 Tax=Diospyros lotus TaxID=55363 RepID=UPI0022582C13|nr:uncharacterized protein LOC127798288 isoform X2 [Diospyros lotus]
MASSVLARSANPSAIFYPLSLRCSNLPAGRSVLKWMSARGLHASSAIASVSRRSRARKSIRLQTRCCAGSPAVASDRKYGNKQVISVTSKLYDYLLMHTREPEILRELREETATMRGSQMQGYSSLAIALVLPESGCIVACERDKASIEVAKKYYERAGVLHKVVMKLGLAVDALKSMIQSGETCSYDFAFVDADKRMYQEYFELLLQLVRVGGLIVIDNVLWHGKVADPLVNDSKTISIRNFNRSIFEDKRISISTVPIGDGMTICRKL